MDLKCYKLVILTLFIFALNPKLTKGQTNYQPGFIVINGDTTRGFIDYLEWAETPEQIFFKETEQGSPLELTPTDINSFFVSAEIYISKRVKIDKTPLYVNTNSTLSLINKEFEEKRVFIQQINKSKNLNLYLYRKGRDNYYLQQKEVFIALISHVFVQQKGGGFYVNQNNTYKFREQIRSLMPSCLEEIKIERLKYNLSSLSSFVSNCNLITNEKNDYTYKIPKVTVKSGVVVNTGYKVHKENISRRIIESEINFKTSYDIEVGYSSEIILPRGRGLKRLNIELLISAFRTSSEDRIIRTFETGTCGMGCSVIEEVIYSDVEGVLSYAHLKVVFKRLINNKKRSFYYIAGIGIGKKIYSNVEGNLQFNTFQQQENQERMLVDSETREENLINYSDVILHPRIGLGYYFETLSLGVIIEPRVGKEYFSSYNSISFSMRLGL